MKIDAKLCSLPATLHPENIEKTTSFCYAVNWTEDGRILCARNVGAVIRSDNLKMEKTILLPDTRYTFLAKLIGNILYSYATSWEDEKYVTYGGSLEQPTERVIYSVVDPKPNKITHLSVNKSYLATIE